MTNGGDQFNNGNAVSRTKSYDMTLGGGNDTISAYGDNKEIKFGPGVTAGDISYSTVGNDRIVTYPGGQITITNGAAGSPYQVQTIRLNDGSVISIPY